jgi:hypothetical protein
MFLQAGNKTKTLQSMVLQRRKEEGKEGVVI